MTAKTTRILKEARLLFWPWCAVTAAGVLPLIPPLHAVAWISAFGFYLGIPLLATLPLGNEFQHRTLSLLLSQPVDRMEIWGEKMRVTVVAVLPAVLIFSIAGRLAPIRPSPEYLLLVEAWTIALIASATFWTLFARSTMGGVVLNIAGIFFIMIALNLAQWLGGREYLLPAKTTVVLTVAFISFLCYAGVMLWLGRRALARFQVTGGLASDDLLMAGPDVMPGALGGWLRCRPTGMVFNLIRKELRLLRPVWLITLLAALCWICLILFGLLHPRGLTRSFEFAVTVVGVFSALFIAMLAGSLPLGEEKTSGTYSWHMTLPVSALRQWLIKLFMALFGGLIGAGLLPAFDRRKSPIGIVAPFCGSAFRNNLAARSVSPYLCRILVRVRDKRDGECGGVGLFR